MTKFGTNVFAGCDLLTLTVDRDSRAEQYCGAYGLRYRYADVPD